MLPRWNRPRRLNLSKNRFAMIFPAFAYSIEVFALTEAAPHCLSDAKLSRTALPRLHHDLYLVSQRNQKSHQTFDGVSAELSSQHGGNLRLIDPHEFRCGR